MPRAYGTPMGGAASYRWTKVAALEYESCLRHWQRTKGERRLNIERQNPVGMKHLVAMRF